MAAQIEKQGYTVAEFCAAFPVKKTKFWELIGRGEITAKKSGKTVIVTNDEAARWLASLPPVVTGRNPVTPRQQSTS